MPQTMFHQANIGDPAVSELISEFARMPAIMVVGDAPRPSSNTSESFPQAAPVHGATPLHQSHGSSHIRFRGDYSNHTPPPEGEPHYDHRHQSFQPQEPHPPGELPPPSPRLEPTHRSALSLNGSVANSPSRIKVRDLEHIHSFASEEVLIRSRHPSRHSLRGRLAGGQQYEISAMPVADIIEMVAGLLTKITTTVLPLSFVFCVRC